MRKILKGAVVLLIVAALFFSTTAVTADDEETPQSELGKNSQPQNMWFLHMYQTKRRYTD